MKSRVRAVSYVATARFSIDAAVCSICTSIALSANAGRREERRHRGAESGRGEHARLREATEQCCAVHFVKRRSSIGRDDVRHHRASSSCPVSTSSSSAYCDVRHRVGVQVLRLLQQIAQPRVVDCHASLLEVGEHFGCVRCRIGFDAVATRMEERVVLDCDASGDVADGVGRVLAHRHTARDFGRDREALGRCGRGLERHRASGSRPSTPNEIVPVRVIPTADRSDPRRQVAAAT